MQGDLHDHESLVKAIKQVDVVISTVGNMQLADQTKLITAIKEAGNVKVGAAMLIRFLNLSMFACICVHLKLIPHTHIYTLILVIKLNQDLTFVYISLL